MQQPAQLTAQSAAPAAQPGTKPPGPSIYAAFSGDNSYGLVLHNADPTDDGIVDNRLTMWSYGAKVSIDAVPTKGVYDPLGEGCVITGQGTYNRKPATITATVAAVRKETADGQFNGEILYYGVRFDAYDPATNRTLWSQSKPSRLFLCYMDLQ